MAYKKLSSYETLSVPERILVLQDLWDEIAADPDQIPLSDGQRTELDRRLKGHVDDPDAVSGWEHVKARVRTKK